MGRIRKLVLDVLKPHQPDIIEFAKFLAELEGIDSVDISLIEMDINVESVKIIIDGSNINYEDVEKVVNENGGTIHSIDEVYCGSSSKEAF